MSDILAGVRKADSGQHAQDTPGSVEMGRQMVRRKRKGVCWIEGGQGRPL